MSERKSWKKVCGQQGWRLFFFLLSGHEVESPIAEANIDIDL